MHWTSGFVLTVCLFVCFFKDCLCQEHNTSLKNLRYLELSVVEIAPLLPTWQDKSTQREAKVRSGNHGDQLSFHQRNYSMCVCCNSDRWVKNK